jgi:hypothetical protein
MRVCARAHVCVSVKQKDRTCQICIIVQGKYGIVNVLTSFIQEQLDGQLKYGDILMMIECKCLYSNSSCNTGDT